MINNITDIISVLDTLASQTLENKVIIKQIIIGCGYSGRGYETERESGEMLTSHRLCTKTCTITIHNIHNSRSQVYRLH